MHHEKHWRLLICNLSKCDVQMFLCVCVQVGTFFMHHAHVFSSLHMRFDFAFKHRITSTFHITWKREQEPIQLMFPVIWLRTLIQRVNIYLFQFNWIALINVSSAFIWWERIKKNSDSTHESYNSVVQLFRLSNGNIGAKQKQPYPTIRNNSNRVGNARNEEKQTKSLKINIVWARLGKKCTTLLLKSKQLGWEKIV